MSDKNKVTKRWATFPKFTDKELIGIAARGQSVFDCSDEERSSMLNHGRLVVCWNECERAEHANLKLGTLCGLTLCHYGRMEAAVRLENGETFRCSNAVIVPNEDGILPYVVGARKPGTFDGCEVIGRLVGFVENYDKTVHGYLISASTGDFICMKKECLAFVSDIKFGL